MAKSITKVESSLKSIVEHLEDNKDEELDAGVVDSSQNPQLTDDKETKEVGDSK